MRPLFRNVRLRLTNSHDPLTPNYLDNMIERGILHHWTRRFGMIWSINHVFRHNQKKGETDIFRRVKTENDRKESYADQLWPNLLVRWSIWLLSNTVHAWFGPKWMSVSIIRKNVIFRILKMIDSCSGDPNRSKHCFHPKPTRNTMRICFNIPSTQKVRGELVKKRPRWNSQTQNTTKKHHFPCKPSKSWKKKEVLFQELIVKP